MRDFFCRDTCHQVGSQAPWAAVVVPADGPVVPEGGTVEAPSALALVALDGVDDAVHDDEVHVHGSENMK